MTALIIIFWIIVILWLIGKALNYFAEHPIKFLIHTFIIIGIPSLIYLITHDPTWTGIIGGFIISVYLIRGLYS